MVAGAGVSSGVLGDRHCSDCDDSNQREGYHKTSAKALQPYSSRVHSQNFTRSATQPGQLGLYDVKLKRLAINDHAGPLEDHLRRVDPGAVVWSDDDPDVLHVAVDMWGKREGLMRRCLTVVRDICSVLSIPGDIATAHGMGLAEGIFHRTQFALATRLKGIPEELIGRARAGDSDAMNDLTELVKQARARGPPRRRP